LKYCVGSAAALGLEFSNLGPLQKVLAGGVRPSPTYPIAPGVIYTTLDRTVIPAHSPPSAKIYPYRLDLYGSSPYYYGVWDEDQGLPAGPPVDYVSPDMQTGAIFPSDPDPSAVTLLYFFTMSDVHICDKESPARSFYAGYEYPYPAISSSGSVVWPPNSLSGAEPAGSSSCYSGIVLYTTHVLDAAVQTINAMHQTRKFDFGIALGDAADNTQLNELRWYIDVLDGKLITPSSGAHLGANSTVYNYQRPYQAAGLDPSIKWYQAIGNHDQFWMGSAIPNSYIRQTLVGSAVLNLGLSTNTSTILSTRGYYVGVVNGSDKYGNIIDVGQVQGQPVPKVAADWNRRSLAISDWMWEFTNTTSQPVGHGFTEQMINEGFACYHFYPKANMPIKVIVLDDTDKTGSACGALDATRYNWLVNELKAGQAADELMIVCAHIPVRPYAQRLPQGSTTWPLMSIWAPYSPVSENTLLATLHSFPNLVLWIAGHVHRNTITPQPANPGYSENGFWEVETPSLRDYPQQFRRFEIVRNSNNTTISILVTDVDTAANPNPAAYNLPSPAYTSRSYALGAQQIFGNPWQQGPGMDPSSCVYNAQLVIQLSQLSTGLQKKIKQIT
jgi:metallophosphoesterase (TIGR03768 family)